MLVADSYASTTVEAMCQVESHLRFGEERNNVTVYSETTYTAVWMHKQLDVSERCLGIFIG